MSRTIDSRCLLRSSSFQIFVSLGPILNPRFIDFPAILDAPEYPALHLPRLLQSKDVGNRERHVGGLSAARNWVLNLGFLRC